MKKLLILFLLTIPLFAANNIKVIDRIWYFNNNMSNPVNVSSQCSIDIYTLRINSESENAYRDTLFLEREINNVWFPCPYSYNKSGDVYNGGTSIKYTEMETSGEITIADDIEDYPNGRIMTIYPEIGYGATKIRFRRITTNTQDFEKPEFLASDTAATYIIYNYVP